MSVVRSFIAIDFSAEVNKNVELLLQRLRNQVPDQVVRWTPSGNLHLTLKFLGDVSVNSLDLLKDALTGEAQLHPEFELHVSGLGAFPKLSQPRVIWAGIEAPETLMSLQRGIDVQMERLGYAREDRPFTAHLTLGRVSRNAHPEDVRTAAAVLTRQSVNGLGSCRVQQVILYRSDLKPGGSVYTRMHSAMLKQS